MSGLIYLSYNRLISKIRYLTSQLATLPQDDEFRIRITEQLVQKVYNMGLLSDERSLAGVEKLTASSFCRYLFSFIDTADADSQW